MEDLGEKLIERVRRFSLVLEEQDEDDSDGGYAVGLALEDSTPPTSSLYPENPLYMSGGFGGIGRSTTIMSTYVIPDYFDPATKPSSSSHSQPLPIANSISNTTITNAASSSTSSLTPPLHATTPPISVRGVRKGLPQPPIAPHVIESSSSLSTATTDLGEWEEDDHEIEALADLKI